MNVDFVPKVVGLKSVAKQVCTYQTPEFRGSPLFCAPAGRNWESCKHSRDRPDCLPIEHAFPRIPTTSFTQCIGPASFRYASKGRGTMTEENTLKLALANLGRSEATRRAILKILRDAEPQITQNGFDARENVTGPIVDALHRDIQTINIELANGLSFDFPYRSKMAREVAMSGEANPDHLWEPQTTKLLSHLAEGARHVVIGGAYVGEHAIPIAHQIKTQGGTVHCFEANSELSEFLRRNVLRNNVDNVVTNTLALWDDTTDRLVLQGDDCYAGARETDVDTESATIPAVSLNRYAKSHEIDRLDLVMLDIEGGEFAAIKGASDFTAMDPSLAPTIVFEVHGLYTDWSKGLENVELVQHLVGAGYKVFAIRDCQGHRELKDQPIELIPPIDTVIDGPTHGFNMLAIKDDERVKGPLFRVRRGVSPKYLLHRDPKLFAPISD